MRSSFSKVILSTGAAAAVAVGSLPKPAAASEQSTINTILGAAAVVGGIILYNNYQHKRQAANRVVGYTSNGGRVMGDGRIVMQDGTTIYPGSNGQYPWGQYAYYNQNAQYNEDGDHRWRDRDDARYEGARHDNGRHEGWERGRGNREHEHRHGDGDHHGGGDRD